MLTTEQILNAIFTPVVSGAYSAEEVDLFLKRVAESYEEALHTNKELIKKISILADKIESYRSDEEAIKLALLDARRLAESINKEATAKAASTVGAAEEEAKAIREAAEAEAARITDEARASAKGIVDNARVAVQSLTDRAQRETEQAITAAQQKATEIIIKAEAQSKEIVGKSKADFEYYSSELGRIKKETATFKATVKSLLAGQMDLVSSLPGSDSDSAPSTEEEAVYEPDLPDTIEEIIEEVAEADLIVEPVEEIPAPAAEEIPASEETISAPVTGNLLAEIFGEVEKEETPVVAEEIAAEPIEEIEVVEEIPAVEEKTEEVPAEEEEEFIDIPEAPAETEVSAEDEEDVEDLFSMIEELSFDDIVAPEEIPATLDDIAVEIPDAEIPSVEDIPVAEIPVEPVEEESDDDEDFDFDFDDDDDFEGFKVDLDDITSDSDDSDDITSLFDSFFGE